MALQYTPSEGSRACATTCRPPGAATGPASRARRADRDQRRDGLHRADVPGDDRSGDTIAVEAPSYLGALTSSPAPMAEAVAIEMDDEGLARTSSRRGWGRAAPKFVYTIPEYQNPTAGPVARKAPRAGRALPSTGRIALRGRGLSRTALRAHDATVAVVARARRCASGGDVLQELLPRRAARLGGRSPRGDRRAGHRQAEHRPVRGWPRAAPGRGVRPLRGFERHLPARASSTPPWAALWGRYETHARGVDCPSRRAARTWAKRRTGHTLAMRPPLWRPGGLVPGSPSTRENARTRSGCRSATGPRTSWKRPSRFAPWSAAL